MYMKNNTIFQIKFFVSIFFISVGVSGFSQFEFKEAIFQKTFFSGIPISMTDINGDYTDDLIVLDQGKRLWIGLNSGQGHYFWNNLNAESNSVLWSVNIADLDRNGYQDIILGGSNDGIKVYYQYQQGFQKVGLDQSLFFSQSATVYDINRDGWMDYTICDDNAKSKVYINRKGILELDTNLIQLGLTPSSVEAGNYGILWSDFDQDGDGDLYISKCRAGVDNPSDKRRINLYYRNDHGVFTEQGEAYGIACSDQSWTSLNGDINGDGTLDLIVLNHYSPNKIYIQKSNGLFDDVTISSGLNYQGTPLEGALKDWDNDSDLDLLIAGTQVELWLNDGLGHFTKTYTNFGAKPFSSFAVGDINKDGYLDIYASYADLLNYPTNQKDQLWLHPGGQNHWVSLSFKGTISNLNGIGCLVNYYLAGQKFVRELQGGESFGIQNSLNLHLGLKDHTQIDSLLVIWPSGIQDIYYHLNADQPYLIEENGCCTSHRDINPNLDIVQCKGVESRLQSASGLSQLVWNTTETNEEINIKQPGIYFYQARDTNHCLVQSKPIGLIIDPIETPRLNYQYEKLICDGVYLPLSVYGYQQIKWWNGDTNAVQKIDQSGIYFATVQGLCQEFNTDTLHLTKIDPLTIPKVQVDTLFGPGKALLKGDRDELNWYENDSDQTPLLVGKNFESPELKASRQYWVEGFTNTQYQGIHGGMLKPVFESGAYHASFLNPEMFFNAYQDFILDSVTVFTDRAGIRIIELRDGNKKVLLSSTHDLVIGKNQIFLGFSVPQSKGLYSISTNEDNNKTALGTSSPRLERSNIGFYYPFFIQDKCRILTSSVSDAYYYAFFDWVIRPLDEICTSDRIAVPVVVNPVNNDDLKHQINKIRVQQNKVELIISCHPGVMNQVQIVNVQGHILYNSIKESSTYVIPTNQWLKGIYFMSTMDDSGRTYYHKVVID